MEHVPVFKESGLFLNQFGMVSAVNIEKPNTKIFLVEFMYVC